MSNFPSVLFSHLTYFLPLFCATVNYLYQLSTLRCYLNSSCFLSIFLIFTSTVSCCVWHILSFSFDWIIIFLKVHSMLLIRRKSYLWWISTRFLSYCHTVFKLKWHICVLDTKCILFFGVITLVVMGGTQYVLERKHCRNNCVQEVPELQ